MNQKDQKLYDKFTKIKLNLNNWKQQIDDYLAWATAAKMVDEAEQIDIDKRLADILAIEERIQEIELKKGWLLEEQQKVVEGIVDKLVEASPEGLVDRFIKALEAYQKACAEGTLTLKEANQLKVEMSAAITELESDLQNIENQRNLGDSEFLESAYGTTKEKIESYKSELENLSTDCIMDNEPELPVQITKPVDALLETTELDHAYEDVIETNLKMRTGPNPDILGENKRALTEFLENYENASENQKLKWLEAKELAKEQLATLEAKAARAEKTVEDWESAIIANGGKGYYLYAEGYVNGEFIRRMDWKMQTTAAMNGNSTGAGDLGQGARPLGDNTYNQSEIIIDTYTLSADEDGNLVYTKSGRASKFTNNMKQHSIYVN